MAMKAIRRASRMLLAFISDSQRENGSWVVLESTPETWALLHGLKAVYVPHLITFSDTSISTDQQPITFDSVEALDQSLHRGPPWNRAGGEAASFLWCPQRGGMAEPRWKQASYTYKDNSDAEPVWWEYYNGACAVNIALYFLNHAAYYMFDRR